MNRLKTSNALAKLAGLLDDEDSDADDERLLCEIKDDSKNELDDANEEQKEAQLTTLPDGYDLVEEMKEDNNLEVLDEEDQLELTHSRASESLDDEVAEHQRLQLMLERQQRILKQSKLFSDFALTGDSKGNHERLSHRSMQ